MVHLNLDGWHFNVSRCTAIEKESKSGLASFERVQFNGLDILNVSPLTYSTMTTPLGTKTTPGEYLEHTSGRWSE